MMGAPWPTRFKEQVVAECLELGNITGVARRHDLPAGLVHRWVENYRLYGEVSVRLARTKQRVLQARTQSMESPISEVNRLSRDLERMTRLLGEKELKIAILEDLLKAVNPPSPTKQP